MLLELETSELLKEGIAAAKAGARSAARARLLQVTQEDPGNATGWVWLASVTESTEEKVSALRRFLALRPGHSQGLDSFKKALFELGMARAKAGDKRSARDLLKELCELDGRLDQAWFWLASVAANRAEARSCLERVLQLRPDHRQASAMLARLDPPKPSRSMPEEEIPPPVAAVAKGPVVTAHLPDPSIPQTRESRGGADLQQADNPLDPRFRGDDDVLRQPPVVQASAAWLCPLCRTPSDEMHHRCPSCKAILDFEPLSDVLENRDVDEKLLRESIIRSKNLADSDLGFEAQICLALAYLNLKKLDESVRHLELACRLHPNDEALQATLNAIRGHTKPAASPATRGTILAVDDSPTVQKLISMTLERRGYRVMLASDGMQALARLNEVKADLVLLDIDMPQIDGYQLCKLIKNNEATRGVQIVMLTGKDGFFDKIRARMAGASDYVTKPFEPNYLAQVVEKHIKPQIQR